MPPPRMTAHTLTVLRALAAAPGREMYGLEIVQSASLRSGTLWPLLRRTESAGWIESRTEDIDPKTEKRPRRRYYKITPDGRAAVRQAMELELARLTALGVTSTPETPASLRLHHGNASTAERPGPDDRSPAPQPGRVVGTPARRGRRRPVLGVLIPGPRASRRRTGGIRSRRNPGPAC